jgi:transposase
MRTSGWPRRGHEHRIAGTRLAYEVAVQAYGKAWPGRRDTAVVDPGRMRVTGRLAG